MVRVLCRWHSITVQNTISEYTTTTVVVLERKKSFKKKTHTNDICILNVDNVYCHRQT